MNRTTEKVINHLNESLGNDVQKCENLQELYIRLQNEKDSIEKMLSLESNAAPSKFSAAVQKVDRVSEKIESLCTESAELRVTVEKMLKSREPVVSLVKDQLQEVRNLEHTKLYLKQVDKIQKWSNQLKEDLKEHADIRCVSVFCKLVEFSEQLRNSQSVHLFAYLHETVLFWHNILKERFSEEFEQAAVAANWPLIGKNALQGPPTNDAVPRLQSYAQFLLQLRLPEDVYQKPMVDSAVVTDALPLSAPITLLLRPLRKRFMYHFCLPDKDTNRPDKPEWCFTQVLKWIRDHCHLVEQWIQPVMDRLGMAGSSAKIELIRGLSQMVARKLHAELPQLEYDDALFAHTVDETLAFARDLRDSYEYKESTILAVLTTASVFQRWLHLEKKFALEKMDNVLSSGTSWELLISGDEDELKRTECADGFLTLLLCLTDRYSLLPEAGHRLQFARLQLELVDDFRVRLVQLVREEDSTDPLSPGCRLPAILNSVNYVATVLAEWNANLHFLQLQVYQEKLRSKEPAAFTEGVFDACLNLLEGMRDDLLAKICQAAFQDIKNHSHQYCRDRWVAMKSPQETGLSVTPSACDFFRILSFYLSALQSRFALSLFTKAWTWLADELNQLLFQELVLKNYFNEGGANQFQMDVVRNLLPLFGQMTPQPDAYFPQLRESCILLTTLHEEAIQLQSKLEKATKGEDKAALKSLGIFTLSKSTALKVLQRRTDFMSVTDINELM